jgi:hypothetical protein
VKAKDVQALINAFPVVLAGGRPEGRAMTDEEKERPLTGYFHASSGSVEPPDVHGHYIEDADDSVAVIHEHKGGRRAHDHAQGARK